MTPVVAAAGADGPARCMNNTTRGCLGVIVFLYLATVCNVIVPRLGYSVHGAGNLLTLSALTALATVTFLQCIYCDPGRVPPHWQPDAEQEARGAAAAVVVQVKRHGGGRRYCKKCKAFKPPRTHHCRRCGHCVLRMDHHCIWVNNCIGHGNFRAFLLMCTYLTAACLHALGLLLAMDAHLVQVALGWDEQARLLAAAGGTSSSSNSGRLPGTAAAAGAAAAGGMQSRVGWHGPFWLHATVQVLATAVALPVSAGLLVLFFWNGYLFLRNQTTIEYHEGVVSHCTPPGQAQQQGGGGASSSGGGGRGSSRHPFDLGWHDNLHTVCGEELGCWPLPVRPAAEGDGLTFPTPWDRDQPLQQQ